MTVRLCVVVAVSFCLFSFIETERDSCSIPITKQIPRNEPVYLIEKANGHLKLYEPSGSNIEVSSDEKLILFCPGRRNTLIHSTENSNELPCANNFRSKLHQSNCTRQVTGDLETTTKTCQLNHRRGLVYRAGFAVERKFAELFEICYDSQSASAIYSHHQINGKSIKHNIKESKRVSFKIDGTPKRAKAEVNYRKQAQIDHFTRVLGRSQHYFTNNSFLARGHLAPDADFVFSSAQFATYFYANVCPQFQSINGGNWNRVENLARQLAAQEQTNLDIYTGTYGQLQLVSSSGDLVPLYLSETDQIEVPEYLWKIVHNPHTSAAIVFITMNNPFARRSDVRELCPDICERNGFTFPRNARSGFTYCCTYDDFARQLTPHPLRVNRLLSIRAK